MISVWVLNVFMDHFEMKIMNDFILQSILFLMCFLIHFSRVFEVVNCFKILRFYIFVPALLIPNVVSSSN